MRRVGKEVIRVSQSLASADEEIEERIARIQHAWIRTRAQIDVVERIWMSLSEEHQAMQAQAFAALLSKLNDAKHRLERLLKKPKDGDQRQMGDGRPKVRRWKYIFVKPHLDDTIMSLEKWRAIYDPTWYLMIRVASPVIDAELKRDDGDKSEEAKKVRRATARIRGVVQGDSKTCEAVHVSLPSDRFDRAKLSPIPYCSARYMRSGESERYIVDSVPCVDGSYVGQLSKDIRTLARKLSCADPSTFGVLNCRGYVKLKTSNNSRTASYEIIFNTPSLEQPRSLRSCLVAGTSHTLTERMELAKQLARSVSYIHTLDFVHKNIRPETFLGFGDSQLGSFFLIGFEHVRNADGITQLRGDVDWHRNLYRHPDRQGLRIQERYCMQHDIYSLGVCLLELGLWKSLVQYGDDGKPRMPNTAMFGLSIEELKRKKPAEIKDVLVEIARKDLPAVVGEVYMQVVVNCLTCLDEENVDFGEQSEFEDADGVTVGVRFIEKVRSDCSRLNFGEKLTRFRYC